VLEPGLDVRRHHLGLDENFYKLKEVRRKWCWPMRRTRDDYLMARRVTAAALASRGPKPAAQIWPVSMPLRAEFPPGARLWEARGGQTGRGLTCCPTPPSPLFTRSGGG